MMNRRYFTGRDKGDLWYYYFDTLELPGSLVLADGRVILSSISLSEVLRQISLSPSRGSWVEIFPGDARIHPEHLVCGTMPPNVNFTLRAEIDELTSSPSAYDR